MNRQQSIKNCVAVIIIILTIASVLALHTLGGDRDGGLIKAPPENSNADLIQAPAGQKETELYQEMLITALYPYIQKSVTEYYNSKDVLAPPYAVQVVEATRPTAEQVYELRLEVEPYAGPHDSVGIDRITMRISPTAIDVVSFEHIESFPLPSNLQSLVKQ